MLLYFLGPLWVVVKFAENGCLLDYVREHKKQDYGYANYINTNIVENESKGITQIEKLRLAYGIAKGMEHLAKMKVKNAFRLFYFCTWTKETDFPPSIMTNHQAAFTLKTPFRAGMKSLLQLLLLAGLHFEIICSHSIPPPTSPPP